MTQLEATVTILDFLREQAVEEPRLKRAMKVLEHRHSILRARHELQHASVAADIRDEPLTVTLVQVRAIFDGEVCVACFLKKPTGCCFCARCWRDVDGPTRKAFRFPKLYLHAYCRALRQLGCQPRQGTGEMEGMVFWQHVSRRHQRPQPSTLTSQLR